MPPGPLVLVLLVLVVVMTLVGFSLLHNSVCGVPCCNDSCTHANAFSQGYGDRVVAFMRRPDIYDVMSAANNSSMSSGLRWIRRSKLTHTFILIFHDRSAIDRIRRDGKSALESIQRTCDDDISLELMIILRCVTSKLRQILLISLIITYNSVLNDEIGRYSQAPVVSIVEPRTGPSNTSGAASATAERIDPLSILYARCAIHVFNRDYQAVINGKGSSLSQTQM